MASKIPWTNETWNFLGGCSRVSEGCDNCCAARQAQWLVNMGNKKYEGLVKNGRWTGEVRLFPEELDKPLHWRKNRRVFPAFMGDLFHEKVPDRFIGDVFEVVRKTPRHTHLILTKRVDRMVAIANNLIWAHGAKYFKHVQWGVTCENQATADERIPILLQIPGAVKFVSAEPTLESIDFQPYCDGIDWFIFGCESGPKHRHISLENFRETVFSVDSQAAVFVKQIDINGKVSHNINKFPDELQLRQYPKGR